MDYLESGDRKYFDGKKKSVLSKFANTINYVAINIYPGYDYCYNGNHYVDWCDGNNFCSNFCCCPSDFDKS
jgi:hypothetical protein